MFLRLKGDSVFLLQLAYQAVRISNILYVSDAMRAFENAKGFTILFLPGTAPNSVPGELLNAQQTLSANLNLALIPRSQAASSPSISAGDVVQIFVKKDNKERGKCSSQLSYRQTVRQVLLQ